MPVPTLPTARTGEPRADGGDTVACAILLLLAALLALLAANAFFTAPDPETAARGDEAGAQLGGL